MGFNSYENNYFFGVLLVGVTLVVALGVVLLGEPGICKISFV
jgi:hypothetical protein